MIYILKHPKAGFEGILGGISFFNGIGSTNSFRDKTTLVETHKCKDITKEYWDKKKKEATKAKKATSKKTAKK